VKILFFGNCCESLECEEKISKFKIVKSSQLRTLHATAEIFLLSDFVDNMCMTDALSLNETIWGGRGGRPGFLLYLFSEGDPVRKNERAT
jgi:hypothetical protein